MRRAQTGSTRRASQAGVGMVLMMGLGMLVIAMAFVAHRIFDGAVSSSTSHVTYEQALHLAETGIDQTLARLQKNEAYSNAAAFPNGVVAGADEKTWVKDQIAAAAPEKGPEGEYVAIKPPNRNVVYGASWIPNKATAKRTRIVKAEYLLSAYNPSHAFLVGGDLLVAGSPVITGAGGNVHSNGDLGNNDPALGISGNPTISGNATTAGDLAVSGSPNVGGLLAGSQPAVDVPEIDPLDLWNRNAKLPAYSANWYDLCKEADPALQWSVRSPDGAGPCQGTILASHQTHPSDEYRAFKLSGSTWDVSGNDPSYHGVYYAHEASIKVAGNPGTHGNEWRTTLIASGKGTCAAIVEGDVTVTGNPHMTAYLDGVLIFAGRDAQISGNPNQTFYTGLVAAHEQVIINGNPDMSGAFIAEDICDSNGTGIVKINGNANITYDGSLEVPIGTVIRTTLWLEL